MDNQKKENKNSKQKQLSKVAEYSGLGIQMAFIIGGFAWLGNYLDLRYSSKTPWVTIVLSLIGVSIGLYVALKGVIKKNKDE